MRARAQGACARRRRAKWCAHAVITPKRGRDKATIEVYFEAPAKGKPGAPFAFRGDVMTKEGRDYVRETWGFAGGWKEAHVPGYTSSGFQGCNQ